MIKEFMEDFYEYETIERPHGFISFELKDENMLVHHFYTNRDHRGKKYCHLLWNDLVDVCHERGVTLVEALIDLQLKDAREKFIIFNKVGFMPVSANNDDVLIQNRKIKKYGVTDG